MEEGEIVRSRESRHNAFVLFVNNTNRVVQINWVDYEGKFIPYMILESGAKTMVNTFSTHPWVFKDYSTGERMHVQQKPIFWPKPFFVWKLEPNSTPSIARKQINIHFPLRSLKCNAMWVIIRKIANASDIDDFDIPKILKNQLQILFSDCKKQSPKELLS